MSDDDTRRAVAVLALIFIVVLAGCAAPFSSSDGTGDLTVQVVGEQDGQSLEGKTATIKNDETGEVVYEGETGPNGQITTTLAEGEYTVVTGKTSDTVEVDEDGADIELEVAVSPPKTDEET